jgi:hypothetical protein
MFMNIVYIVVTLKQLASISMPLSYLCTILYYVIASSPYADPTNINMLTSALYDPMLLMCVMSSEAKLCVYITYHN